MATADTCTNPEEGWVLVGHFLGNVLAPIRITVIEKSEGWQSEVAGLREKLIERLRKITARMNEHGHTEDSAKMEQICALVEGCDLNDLSSIEAVFAKEKEVSPTRQAMDVALKQLFGAVDPSFPPSEGLADGTYFYRTALVEHMGNVPTCCGEPMSAEDDHGRFRCWKCNKTVAV